jgi:hypothetical protein
MPLRNIALPSYSHMFSWRKQERDFIYDQKISAILPAPIFTKSQMINNTACK